MSKTNITEIIESEIDTVLAEDIDFTGVLKFNKSLMIKGKFEGNIEAKGHLFLGPNSYVKAEIKVDKLTCYGKIDGNIYATERVELSKESELNGDIFTPDLVIESGCKFNGKCSMDIKKSPHQQQTQQQQPQQKK
ncbi:MAG: polymer-forming cytoskeletal protein [Spirochaetes bacterium]|nr:polymer-forming cytoskeletal protein [Spirochaetota bacterium]